MRHETRDAGHETRDMNEVAMTKDVARRDFLKAGVVIGGVAVGGAALVIASNDSREIDTTTSSPDIKSASVTTSTAPDDLYYTRNHDWVRVIDSQTIRIGITYHAQEALGEMVYVELSPVGVSITLGAVYGQVEATKSVSDVYAPAAGVISQTNAAVISDPGLLNSAPYTAGWLIEMRDVDRGQIDVLLSSGGLLRSNEYVALIS